MKRSKRFTLRRIALGLAVVAVLVPAAQAKPTAAKQRQSTVEIPYLSHGILKAPVGSDDRTYSRASSDGVAAVEIPYLSHGTLQAPAGSDDRAFSKATSVGAPSVQSGSGGYDVSLAPVGGFGLALMLLAGASVAIRHSRRTKLSPA
jgi:hypothetical protein